jgi:hypothetical protein
MLLLHNMIGSPKVMRRGHGLLRAAERRGEVDPVYVEVLDDQILTLEGRSQQYGTQFDWDDDGELNPLPIADLQDLDERRRAAGACSFQRHNSFRPGIPLLNGAGVRHGHRSHR